MQQRAERDNASVSYDEYEGYGGRRAVGVKRETPALPPKGYRIP
jgi:hypothetical protein